MAHPLLLNKTRHIELSPRDRRQNMLISGLPSTGISTYLLDIIKQDINAGTQVILFDPYGDLTTALLETISDEQLEKTAYIEVGNTIYPVGLNIFEAETDEEKRDVANTVIDLLYALYDPNKSGVIGPRFEHAVRNAISTIFYDKNTTFVELLRCLTDVAYVNKLLPHVTDPFVKAYWTKQIAQTSDFHKSEVLDYIVSKFSKFVSDKKVRNIVGQQSSKIHFKQLLEEKKIILFDAGKIRDDYEATRILHEIIVMKLMKAIRHQIQKIERSIYIDEAFHYSSHRLTELLSTARRDSVNVTITTQRISDIEASLRKELLKSGTLVAFRQSTDNARLFAPEFHRGTITVDQLCMLKQFHMSIKTLHNGNPVVYEEVSTEGLQLDDKPVRENVDQLKVDLIKQYGKDVAKVEQEITARMT